MNIEQQKEARVKEIIYLYYYEHGFFENDICFQGKNKNCETCRIGNEGNDYRYKNNKDKFSEKDFGEGGMVNNIEKNEETKKPK